MDKAALTQAITDAIPNVISDFSYFRPYYGIGDVSAGPAHSVFVAGEEKQQKQIHILANFSVSGERILPPSSHIRRWYDIRGDKAVLGAGQYPGLTAEEKNRLAALDNAVMQATVNYMRQEK